MYWQFIKKQGLGDFSEKYQISFVIFLFQSMLKHGLNYRWILRLQLMRFRLKPCLAAPWLKFPTYWKSLRILSCWGCRKTGLKESGLSLSQEIYKFQCCVPQLSGRIVFVQPSGNYCFEGLGRTDLEIQNWIVKKQTQSKPMLKSSFLRKKCLKNDIHM